MSSADLFVKLNSLPEDLRKQVLDYIEFLESRYGRRAAPGGIFEKITETVEDALRAGKLPVKAVSGTMSVMDTATKLMKGVAAAGQAAVEEAVKAVGQSDSREVGTAQPPPAAEPPSRRAAEPSSLPKADPPG